MQSKRVHWQTVAMFLPLGMPALAAAQTPCIHLTETVIDRSTAVPLTGAAVSVTWGAPEKRLRASADSLGRAVLCVPARQALTIRAEYADLNASWRVTFDGERAAAQHTSTIDVPGYIVRGRVVAQDDNRPLPNVSVQFPNTSLHRLTDADGRFVFARVPTGRYQLRVEHLAYASQSAMLEIRDDDLDAAVRLTPAAIALPPIVVTAFSQRLERVGFYDRRKRGGGVFIDRRQIDAMNVQDASDLLRRVPSVRLIPQARRNSNQPRNATIGRQVSCRYTFIIDGVRTLGDFEMDYLAASALEGVEIYNGLAQVPANFKAHGTANTGAPTCGVIAMWTRNSR